MHAYTTHLTVTVIHNKSNDPTHYKTCISFYDLHIPPPMFTLLIITQIIHGSRKWLRTGNAWLKKQVNILDLIQELFTY